MKEDTKNQRSILSQVIRGLFIASVIVASILILISILVRPNSNGRASALTLDGIRSLARAINAFEDEYQRPPDVSSLDFETEGPQAAKFIAILLGKEKTPEHEMQNRRQIAFLTARNTKHRKQGGLVSTSTNEIVGLYDGWGNPVRVILRAPGQSSTTFSLNGKIVTVDEPVAVLSRGPDQKWGTDDDLDSWGNPK